MSHDPRPESPSFTEGRFKDIFFGVIFAFLIAASCVGGVTLTVAGYAPKQAEACVAAVANSLRNGG